MTTVLLSTGQSYYNLILYLFLCSWIQFEWILFFILFWIVEIIQIIPWRPMTLLMTTMCPERLFFMSGITSLIMRTTPKKLVSNTLFISSMLMLSTGPSKPTPALLTDRKHTDTGMLYRQHCNNQTFEMVKILLT